MIPKFRAFDKATGERFFVTDMDWDEERLVISPEKPPARNGPWFDRRFNDVIFEQSTGLPDANGVEIFEGDLLVYRRSHMTTRGPYPVCLNHASGLMAGGYRVSRESRLWHIVGQHDYLEDQQ